MMKATHQSKLSDHQDVTAWQFALKEYIPIWVARKFHRFDPDRGIWEAISSKGEPLIARSGDWAVAIDKVIIIVLTDQEFQLCFTPL